MSDLNIGNALKIIPEFDGTPAELHRFLACCQVIHSPLKQSEITSFLNLLKAKLVGKAYEVIKYDTFESWNELKDALKLNFGHSRSLEVIQMDMLSAKQLKNESVMAYSNRVEKLLHELNDACLVNTAKPAVASIKNLNARTAQEGLIEPIKLLVKACRFKEMQEAVAKACEEETLIANSQHKPSSFQSPNVLKSEIKCQICYKIGHTVAACYRYQNKNNQVIDNSRRFQNSSSTTFRNSAYKPNQDKPSNSQNVMVCSYCHKIGHEISVCRKRQFVNDRRQSNNRNNSNSKSFQSQKSENSQELEKFNTPSRVRDLQQ